MYHLVLNRHNYNRDSHLDKFSVILNLSSCAALLVTGQQVKNVVDYLLPKLGNFDGGTIVVNNHLEDVVSDIESLFNSRVQYIY